MTVVGAAARDVAPSDPRGWRLGGGVTYGALTLARLGLAVRALVGVDADAASAAELDDLAAAGVKVERIRLASGPVFENVETPAGRRQRCLAASSPLSVTAARDLDASTVLLAPVAGELSEAWAAAIPPDALVGLGLQGLLRGLRPGAVVARRPPRPSALLARADLVGLSSDDLPQPGDLATVLSLARPGATVFVTDAARGGVAITVGPAERARRYSAIRPDRIVDPTGAGDVFLAAVLAARLDPSLLRVAGGDRAAEGDARATTELRFAAAVASLVTEAAGLAGVSDLAAVRRRLDRARRRARRWTTAASIRGSGRPSQA